MNTTKKHRPIPLIAVVAVLAVVAIAVIKRQAIADLILRGSDTTLTGEEAQNGPHAAVAVEFLSALRARDMEAIGRLATAEQVTRVQQDPSVSAADSEMLADLPADANELRNRIKSVQTHEDRAVVLFETDANSWFVQLTSAGEGWKVSGF